MPRRLQGLILEFILVNFLNIIWQFSITNGVTEGEKGRTRKEQGSEKGRARKKQNMEESEKHKEVTGRSGEEKGRSRESGNRGGPVKSRQARREEQGRRNREER